MYRCELCGDITPKGTPRHLIVKTQPWNHPYRRSVNKKFFVEKGRKVEKWVDDPGGNGPQVMAEFAVCATCHVEHKSKLEKTSPGSI